MYDFDEERLFGHDMRHRPGPRRMPAYRYFWHGKYEGYGNVPPGFVTVDKSTLNGEIPKDAVFFTRRKLAIPIKDFARAQRLTIYEQWSLMQHFCINLFYNEGKYRKRYSPSFFKALMEAQKSDKMNEFTAMFWDIRRDDPDMVKHLESSISRWNAKLRIVSEDVYQSRHIANVLYNKVDNGGRLSLDDRKKLNNAECCLRETQHITYELEAKIKSVREYIESRTLEY